MIVSFFEEFPDKESINKAKLIKFPSNAYIASPSAAKFKAISRSLKKKGIMDTIWWPTLKTEEGYWISPWSKRKALKRIFSESAGLKVMLDLELPRDKSLLIKNLLSFFKNKKLIRNFIEQNNADCCEYYGERKFLQKMGLSYDSGKNRIIKMAYRSVHNISDEELKTTLNKNREIYGDRFVVALGTIAKGVTGREPILTPKELERDLKIAKQEGIQEAIIFRLGGLTEEHANAINRALSTQ